MESMGAFWFGYLVGGLTLMGLWVAVRAILGKGDHSQEDPSEPGADAELRR